MSDRGPNLWKGLVPLNHAANLLGVSQSEFMGACERDGVTVDSTMEARDLLNVATKMAALEPDPDRKARLKDGIQKLRKLK